MDEFDLIFGEGEAQRSNISGYWRVYIGHGEGGIPNGNGHGHGNGDGCGFVDGNGVGTWDLNGCGNLNGFGGMYGN